jgi:hypothetical protein
LYVAVVSIHAASVEEAIGILARWSWDDFDSEAWTDPAGRYVQPTDDDTIEVRDVEAEP